MSHYKRRSVYIGLVVLVAGLLAACQSTPTLAILSTPGISVGIMDDLCPNITVQAGQQVTWTNQGSRQHIVRDATAPGERQFDSGILEPGDFFSFTFPQPGSFEVACSEDEALTGTITVEP